MPKRKPKRAYRRVWVKPLTKEEKACVTEACERLITEKLKPRFLPEVRLNEQNYPVDIRGRWRSNTYAFFVRYRSGWPDNAGEEHDRPFARIDHLEESGAMLFDVMWFRHTGRWWCVHREVPLDQALRLIETDHVLRPPIWPR